MHGVADGPPSHARCVLAVPPKGRTRGRSGAALAPWRQVARCLGACAMKEGVQNPGRCSTLGAARATRPLECEDLRGAGLSCRGQRLAEMRRRARFHYQAAPPTTVALQVAPAPRRRPTRGAVWWWWWVCVCVGGGGGGGLLARGAADGWGGEVWGRRGEGSSLSARGAGGGATDRWVRGRKAGGAAQVG